MVDPTVASTPSGPTNQQLSRAAIAAVAVVAVLVVTTVLPAERGIDPTGMGSWLGLTAMGELKMAPVSPVTATPAPSSEGAYAVRQDEMTLTLQPGQGSEIKAVMRAGGSLTYAWTASQGELFFDFHGEPKGAASDVFTSFEKGTLTEAKGVFEAPFEGVHGWYWKNSTNDPIDVVLVTSGDYATISER